MSTRTARLTTADLVILSLFLEKDQHGYELNAELERREVKDWAGVSRPQVYYSLRKLAEQNFIEPVSASPTNLGPERQVYQITVPGKQAFEEALGREQWVTQRFPPPFLTWLALSVHANTEIIEQMLSHRRQFLENQLATEREHMQIVQAEPGRIGRIAELMVLHTIHAYEYELSWLAEARRVLLED